MAKKPLRAIAEKGDKKLVSDKLKGVNSSKEEPTDLENLVMSPEGNKATLNFAKKYMKVQKHADRVGNKDLPYTTNIKKAPYPTADAKMYEAADCSCDDDKDSCAVHGKGSKKLLLGGKKNMKENLEFSTLDTTPGLVPAGMQAVAKNLWNTADSHLTGPTVATGQGRPFIAKLGDEIRQIQKEAVDVMNGELVEKNWIKGAIKHPGALHKELGVPAGEKIPAAKLNAAAKKPGKEGMRARLAKTLGKMHEEEVNEVAPPSKNSEDWIKKNKNRFSKEYGKKKGEEVLYGKAWKDYKAKHEETNETETEYTNAQNGSTKKQLPGGNDKLDTGTL